MAKYEITITQRSQALSLHASGTARGRIEELTGYSSSGFSRLLRKAKSRGYVIGGPILPYYIEDEPRTGRPLILTEKKKAEIVKVLIKNNITRAYNTKKLGEETNISSTSVWKAIKSEGFNNVKYTTKPGLNLDQKATRFRFTVMVMLWILAQWMCII
jgi:hypothetical protein